MGVVAGNTVLKALDASGNDVGGTSDLLATNIRTSTDVGDAGRSEILRRLPRLHESLPCPVVKAAGWPFGLPVREYRSCVCPHE